MTRFQSFVCLFLTLFSMCILSVQSVNNGITGDDFFTIFKSADRNADEKLQGAELEEAFKEAVILTFRANTIYFDQEMINAIVQELTQKHRSEIIREDFRTLFNSIPSDVHEFRDRIFRELINIYRVQEYLQDNTIVSEVKNNPEVYGLTYAAYQVLTFNFDDAVRRAGVNERHTYGSHQAQSNTRYGNAGSTSTGTGTGGSTYKRTVEEVRSPGATGYNQPSGTYNQNYGYETTTTTTTTTTSTGDYGTHNQDYRQPEDIRREVNINTQESRTHGGQGDNYLEAVNVADLGNVAVGEPVHHTGRIIEETITKRIDVDVNDVSTDGYASYEPRPSHIAIEVEERTVYKTDL